MEAVIELQPMAGTSAVMTEEEFETWCDEDKAEYMNGEVIVHSPVSTRHSDAVWFIGYLLKTIVQQHDLEPLPYLGARLAYIWEDPNLEYV